MRSTYFILLDIQFKLGGQLVKTQKDLSDDVFHGIFGFLLMFEIANLKSYLNQCFLTHLLLQNTEIIYQRAVLRSEQHTNETTNLYREVRIKKKSLF